MKTNETKVKFVEMRARGLSFRKIAAELNTSPETLYRWEKAMRSEIDAKSAAQREDIIEAFNSAENERLRQCAELYQRVSAQIGKDCLNIIPTYQLVRMMLALDRKLARAVTPSAGSPQSEQYASHESNSDVGEEQLSSYIGES
jgi:transcriptional regulator